MAPLFAPLLLLGPSSGRYTPPSANQRAGHAPSGQSDQWDPRVPLQPLPQSPGAGLCGPLRAQGSRGAGAGDAAGSGGPGSRDPSAACQPPGRAAGWGPRSKPRTPGHVRGHEAAAPQTSPPGAAG
ncbi:syntaxin-binding protein 4-like [Platysternon megacephalum]|uniref:Syntaxin-binding protein 4-like n=1 Tax=Platysternon megacephalum TaxID=55544 RepID=A0A4D9EJI5_9SAUR|nr:syntaxin-binding protein 4-like [Platysternon megacephalum]